MNLHRLIAAVFIAVTSIGAHGAHENLGLCEGIDHDASRSHVQLDVDEPPDVSFYPTRALEGPPALRLNDRGLLAEERLLCAWPNGRFQETPEPNRVLGSSPDARCPQSPVKSGFGDKGVGTAVLCIEVVDHAEGIARTEFRGAPLYFSLRSLPTGKWALEPASGRDSQ